jgi:hypothetical protein
MRRTHKDFAGVTHDALLTALIKATSRRIETYLGFSLNLEARTEQFDVERGQQIIVLGSRPTTSVANVRESSERDFTTTGAYSELVAVEEYHVDASRGRIMIDKAYDLVTGPGVLRVVHTSGLAATTADAITNYPDLALACAMQVLHLFNKTPVFGYVSTGGNQGSRTFEEGAALIAAVKDLLNPYRRHGYR